MFKRRDSKVYCGGNMKEVIFVGNPNTGKTTIFNLLTSSDEHTGNWHGVTVEEKTKIKSVNGDNYLFVDLPGLYSMKPLSYEEEVAANYVKNHSKEIIVNVCDANNLERNLYLTLELLENNITPILLVNEMDKTDKLYVQTDYEKLSKLLGVEIVINKKNENKNNILNNILNKNNNKNIKNNINNNKKTFNLLNNNIIADSTDKYNKIANILKQCQKRNKYNYGYSKFDKIILNKFFAIPIFLCIMFCVFYFTFFSVGAYLSGLTKLIFQDYIGGGLIQFMKSITSVEWVIDMFSVAVVGGVGTLLCFLPQIALLFLFLGILEDSGYLARIAFMLEPIFLKVGLSGKSVYTLLMGFGCSTTATMTARNMEDKNAKIKTAMLAPYMSCSAKLPVYLVIGGAFFGAANVWIVFLLYLLGIVIALLLSLFWEKKYLKTKQQSFILEFPPYRMIRIKKLLKTIFTNIKEFLIRVASVVVSVNIIIWMLQSFSFDFNYVKIGGQQSMLQIIGQILCPIFAPLGFANWGATAALICGFVAKEIIVSSIAMFNGVNSDGVSRSIIDSSAVVCFTPASAISYLVFCLLYSPCVATLSVLKKR